jgi:hypothetical protein
MDKFDALRAMTDGKTVKSQFGWLYKINGENIVYWQTGIKPVIVTWDAMSPSKYEILTEVVPVFHNLPFLEAASRVVGNTDLFAIHIGAEHVDCNAFAFDGEDVVFIARDFDGNFAKDGEVVDICQDNLKDRYNIYNMADIEKVDKL